MNEKLKQINVGKIKDAEKASKWWFKKTEREAFMQGFRFARNNLQKQKVLLIDNL